MASGTFGIGDFSLFIANLGTMADCVNRIVELIAESRKAEVSHRRILNVAGNDNANALNADAGIALRSDDAPKYRPIFIHQPLNSFEANNLSYDYGDGHGFNNVSFQVKPGELTVVAGGVGSGKSTLLSVLMGLLPPSSGEMLLDGKPVALAERTPVNIAGAPQHGGFFSKDLKENLCLGFPASQNEMMDALSIAALAELASGSSHDYDSEVGGRGDKLSGGQQQRLAIARMLVRGAQLNIIDDCVSASDEDTRRKVLSQLSEYLKKTSRSAIIATNDHAFLQAANQILFMERVRLVSQTIAHRAQ
jgi:ATP-binding cassette subfamily B protein